MDSLTRHEKGIVLGYVGAAIRRQLLLADRDDDAGRLADAAARRKKAREADDIAHKLAEDIYSHEGS